MARDLQRRSPRSVREAQAYRAVQVGTVSAGAFVVTLVLAIVGTIGAGLPIVLLLLTALAAFRVASVTGWRKRRS
jgi:FtsH-binding integral membrane protein